MSTQFFVLDHVFVFLWVYVCASKSCYELLKFEAEYSNRRCIFVRLRFIIFYMSVFLLVKEFIGVWLARILQNQAICNPYALLNFQCSYSFLFPSTYDYLFTWFGYCFARLFICRSCLILSRVCYRFKWIQTALINWLLIVLCCIMRSFRELLKFKAKYYYNRKIAYFVCLVG